MAQSKSFIALCAVVAVQVLCLLVVTTATVAVDLPKLKLDANSVTLSGISSGAYFASQYHVAFSSQVKGLGMIAGGPFYCADGVVGVALTTCMKNSPAIDVSYLVQIAKNTEAFGYIDPLSNLAGDKVWMMSATNDTVVATGVVKATEAWYNEFVSDASQVKAVYDRPGEHSQQTNHYGAGCDHFGEPFINNCEFDASGEILQHLFDNTLTTPSTFSAKGTYVSVSQKGFTGMLPWSSLYGLNDDAYLYIPRQCANAANECRLHLAFHGCAMTIKDIDMQYVEHSGINRWADANDIVVLYPQAASIPDTNPYGCWDWWGYSGEDYASKLGVQMLTVNNLMNALLSSS